MNNLGKRRKEKIYQTFEIAACLNNTIEELSNGICKPSARDESLLESSIILGFNRVNVLKSLLFPTSMLVCETCHGEENIS
jgi:hypothetical protein